MLTGRRFKLETTTLVIGEANGKRVAVEIPAGGVVKVVAGPRDGDRMIDVLWKGRTLVMFAIDLELRGTEVSEERVR
jgi:hypothetical protein